jgi:protein ImuA
MGMQEAKEHIIQHLKKDLLVLQGFKELSPDRTTDTGLGIITKAFPQHTFPTGAIHEFISDNKEQAAACIGFLTGLLAGLMKGGRACVWISNTRTLFPPALKTFGVQPDQIIFIDLQREKDLLWAMEESLKCEGLAAVIGEIKEISFTASRRLQLAVEQSRVTGFLLRHHPLNQHTIAAVSRWKIIPIHSEPADGMPGIGFPRWQVELVKIRNGKPGNWQLEWVEGSFRHISKNMTVVPEEQIRKTG